MTKKFELVITSGKSPSEASTPTQIVAPSQVARPAFDQGERQSMVNTQAHSIKDEQAAQGISIPWGEALSEANDTYTKSVAASNALSDTENESIITSSPEVTTDEVVAPEIFSSSNDADYFGPIDTDSIDSADVEAALDGIFDNINEVIEGYDPTGSRPESNMPDRWWEPEMAPDTDEEGGLIIPSSDGDEDDDGLIIPSSDGDDEDDDGLIVPSDDGDDDDIIDADWTTLEEPPEGADDPLGMGGNPLATLEASKPDYGRRFDWGEIHDASLAGVSGSSDSAATAIQATGALGLAPSKAGRDAAAGELEKGAVAAKLGVAYATGGEVMPFNESGGEGGSGDVVDTAMSMFGGGGDGGGGGGIDEMVGKAIDEIFAAPLKPIDMFIDIVESSVDALAAWTQAIEESYNEVMGFSGAMIGARVETELALLQKRMERGQELGQEFASFEDARGDLLLAFEDLKTVLLKVFLPIAKIGLKIAAKILGIIVKVLEALVQFYYFMIESMIAILSILRWIPTFTIPANLAIALLRQLEINTATDTATFDSLGGWLQNPQMAINPNVPLP
jgi:hypothetical protein